MKQISSLVATSGPLRSFAGVRPLLLASARARRRAGRRRGSVGWPRCAGCPAVQALRYRRAPCILSLSKDFGSCRITRFACFAALRSNRMRQVRSRSARVRAPTQSLCSSAAPIRPACAPPGALRATGSVCDAPHATTGPATGHPGSAQRACEAPSRRAGTQTVRGTVCALRTAGPAGPARPARPGFGSARVPARFVG